MDKLQMTLATLAPPTNPTFYPYTVENLHEHISIDSPCRVLGCTRGLYVPSLNFQIRSMSCSREKGRCSDAEFACQKVGEFLENSLQRELLHNLPVGVWPKADGRYLAIYAENGLLIEEPTVVTFDQSGIKRIIELFELTQKVREEFTHTSRSVQLGPDSPEATVAQNCLAAILAMLLEAFPTAVWGFSPVEAANFLDYP